MCYVNCRTHPIFHRKATAATVLCAATEQQVYVCNPTWRWSETTYLYLLWHSRVSTKLLENFLQTLVHAHSSAEGGWLLKTKGFAHSSTVYQTMCSRKLFLVDAGLSFSQLVDLAVQKGLIVRAVGGDPELRLA